MKFHILRRDAFLEEMSKNTRFKRKQSNVEIDSNFVVLPDQLVLNEIIYNGIAAKVCKGTFGGSVVAVKQFNLNTTLKAYADMLRKEANLLAPLDHRNLVKFLGCCVEQRALIFEYVEKKLTVDDGEEVTYHDLREMIDDLGECITYGMKLEALVQISDGLKYMHSQKIVHCDLKSRNVLVHGLSEDDFVYKLCDFGESRTAITNITNMQTSNRATEIGTVGYIAPEYLTGATKKMEFAKDIYALAMIMYELLHPDLKHPWESDVPRVDPAIITNLVVKGNRPTISCDTGPLTKLMKKCWSTDVQHRPGIEIVVLKLKSIVELADSSDEELPNESQVFESTHARRGPNLSLYNKSQSSSEKKKRVYNPLIFKDISSISKQPEQPEQKAEPQTPAQQLKQQGATPYGQQDRLLQEEAGELQRKVQSEQFEQQAKQQTAGKQPERQGATYGQQDKLLEEEAEEVVGSEHSEQQPEKQTATEQQDGLLQDEDDDDMLLLAEDDIQKVTNHPSFIADESMDDQLEDEYAVPGVEVDDDDAMKWSGYASKYLDVKNLNRFQLEALKSWSLKRDSLIVQPTSSGKSLCFQLPAIMQKEKLFVIIVPTVALGEDQLLRLRALNIAAEYLSSTTSMETFKAIFSPDPDNRKQVTVLILTPEKLLGSEVTKGVLQKLIAYHKNVKEIALIAIDEVHMVYQWGGNFRKSFDELISLKDHFPDVPIMALTATLPPAFEMRLRSEILRNPIVIKGSVNRPNVEIDVDHYPSPLRTPAGGENWKETSNLIIGKIGTDKAIVYAPYRNICDQICLSLIDLGIQSSAFYGKDKTIAEKKEIHKEMKGGNIQVLVATEAYGLGVNLKSIRYVFYIGVPPNMSVWLQVLGRAGRDGLPAKATILVNEYKDIQRINYWTQTIDNTDTKKQKEDDFKEMLRFIYGAYSSTCLRKLQMRLFNDSAEVIVKPGVPCCTSCRVVGEMPKDDASRSIAQILQALLDLEELEVKCVSESKLIAWVEGSQTKKSIEWWEKMSGTHWKEAFQRFQSFGNLNMKNSSHRGLIRQMIAEGFLDQVFLRSVFHGKSQTINRLLTASDRGRNFLQKQDVAVFLPDPAIVETMLLRKPKQKNTRISPAQDEVGRQIIPKIKSLLSTSSDWTALTRKEQFQFLGYHHNTATLLHVRNVMEAPGTPLRRNVEHFLWDDINLSKCPSHPQVTVDISGKKYIIRKAKCKGVKKCGKDGCSYTMSTKFHSNKCIRHEDTSSVPVGCESVFVYVYPEAEEDPQRWLGFFTSDGLAGSHNHGCPSLNKLGSQLEEMVHDALESDPTKKANEIAKGYGMPCIPAAINLVGANPAVIANARRKFLVGHKEVKAQQLIKMFDSLVKEKIDEKDNNQIEDDEVKEQLSALISIYRRDIYGDEKMELALLMSAQMSSVMSEAEFICADVTFPDVTPYKYLMNFTCFNYLLHKWQITARVLMTSLTAEAYAKTFEIAFKACTNINPEFDMGNNIEGFIVDFSDAQAKGFETTVGETKAAEVLRGCRVHWMRQAMKLSDRVSKNEVEKKLYVKICQKIPDVEDDVHLDLLFSILSGKKKPIYAKEIIELLPEEEILDVAHWSEKSQNWAQWWTRSRHVRMFTKAMKLMTDAEW